MNQPDALWRRMSVAQLPARILGTHHSNKYEDIGSDIRADDGCVRLPDMIRYIEQTVLEAYDFEIDTQFLDPTELIVLTDQELAAARVKLRKRMAER